MGLWSYFKRDSRSTAHAHDGGDELQRLRVQSRQRLVGAAVLIAAGVVAFPLVFETTPRPIATDIPIQIARTEPALLATPAARAPEPAPSGQSTPAAAPASAAPAEAGVAPSPATSPAATAATAPNAAVPPSVKPSPPSTQAALERVAPPKIATKADPTPKPKPAPVKTARADDARARALLEGKDSKPAAGRFVVQVGAFSEEGAARDMRHKVEKLGMKTHTQQVATQAGSRILRVRVGPFPSRDEADRVAARLESAGVSSAVLSL